ncbi:MAG: tRNA (adenosine(37)-N6)-threonylcarbamoyltransferase complex ATPase subunit type 1 TsaE [Oscillospiraceae bacterium]
MQKVFYTGSQNETEALGEELGALLGAGDTVCFYGGLGAGKTALVRGIVKSFGFEEQVTSPTFAIVNEYNGDKIKIAHFDMYRITGEDDLYSTGFYDYLDNEHLILIEWSENIPFALDGNEKSVAIIDKGGDAREIIIEMGEAQ